MVNVALQGYAREVAVTVSVHCLIVCESGLGMGLGLATALVLRCIRRFMV